MIDDRPQIAVRVESTETMRCSFMMFVVVQYYDRRQATDCCESREH